MLRPTLRMPSGYPDAGPHLRDEVRQLQHQLRRWGYSLPTDGQFGPRTDAIVRDFQRKRGLGVDGIVGRNTWDAVLDADAKNIGSTFVDKHVDNPPIEATPVTTNNNPAPTGNIPAWMSVAKKEEGTREIKGKTANPRIVAYHATTTLRSTSDEVAWCASFVNWCLKQCGIRGTNSAGAASWKNWGNASAARYGAIAVIFNPAMARSSLTTTGNHVGFLVEETKTHYVLLGGNQGNSVKVSQYPKAKWKLIGMRWPPS